MITSVFLSAAGVPSAAEGVSAAAPAAKVEAFENAMARKAAEPEIDPVVTSQAAAPAPSGADADAQERARRGLGLDGIQPTPNPSPETSGDMILNGLERLRGVFDVREAHIAELMNKSTLDANTMMAMQMEVANFTLLVDITSKLTGKSTQAFDTLMKGQ